MSVVLYDTPVGLYTVSYKGASKTVDKTEDYFVLESPEIVVSHDGTTFTFTVSKEMYIRMFSRGIIIIGRKHGHVLYGKNRHDFNGLIRGYVEGRKATGGLGEAIRRSLQAMPLFIFFNNSRVYKIYGEEKVELDSMNLLDISSNYVLARDGKWMQVYRAEEQSLRLIYMFTGGMIVNRLYCMNDSVHLVKFKDAPEDANKTMRIIRLQPGKTDKFEFPFSGELPDEFEFEERKVRYKENGEIVERVL